MMKRAKFIIDLENKNRDRKQGFGPRLVPVLGVSTICKELKLL